MAQRNAGSSTSIVVPGSSIGLAQLAANSVDASKIVDGSVGAAEIAGNSISAGHIVDGSIATAELATDAVTQIKVADNAIGTAELINLAVTLGKLAADSVDASKIVDGSIGNAEINAAAGIVSSKLAGYGCYPLANQAIPTAASFSITGIPTTYKHLLVLLSNLRSTAAVGLDSLLVRFNNDSANNYGWQLATLATTYASSGGLGTSSMILGNHPGASQSAGVFGGLLLLLPGYATTNGLHAAISLGIAPQAGTSQPVPTVGAGYSNQTPAVTRLDFLDGSGNFDGAVGGRVMVYGLE